MRRFVSLAIAAVLVMASTAAQALTQEEILKRRLEKMQQVDPQLRTEDQQRRDHIQESTVGVGSGPSAKPLETITIPDPVRKVPPEPKSGLFGQPGGKQAAQPAPVAAPAPQPAAPSYPQPVAQPASRPVYQPTAAPTPMAQPQAPVAQQPAKAPMEPVASPGSRPGNDPKTAVSLAALAAKAQAEGDTQTALTLLDEAIAADPNDADLRNNRGNIVSNLGKPRDALADYDRAIAAKSTDPAFFSNRGLAHERLGNRDRACADYKKACDLGDCEFFTSYKAEGNCR
ncbi:tetratricopeptide repeat protein [Solidesulfovibrio sp.]